MTYLTQCSHTGTVIDEFNTLQEAELAIQGYEEEDRSNGEYEANFYEIKEN